jgi:hypothetical protein
VGVRWPRRGELWARGNASQLELFDGLVLQRPEPSVRCLDCDIDTIELGDFYGVNDSVWLEAVPDGKGMLCLLCLQVRLGRRLTLADFDTAPINLLPRLQARLQKLGIC